MQSVRGRLERQVNILACERQRSSCDSCCEASTVVRRMVFGASRALLLSLSLLLPTRRLAGESLLPCMQRDAIAAAKSLEQMAVLEEVQVGHGGRIVLRIAKASVPGALVGYAGTAWVTRKRKEEEEERLRTQSLLSSLIKDAPSSGDQDSAFGDVESPFYSLLEEKGSLQEAAAAARSAATTEKGAFRKGLQLFQKKATMEVPTIEALTAGDSASATLCKTLAWALRAPIDVEAEATKAADGSELNGASALASEVLDALAEARNKTNAIGMSPADRAGCVEQVGRALLLHFVDEAVKALDDESRFPEAAAAVCKFQRNAIMCVSALGIDNVDEVLYEGNAPRRRLERLYASCLKLAAPELLASIGMGVEDDETPGGPVSLDAVEQLRPLLKLREAKAQRLMQDVMQKEMASMMDDKGDGANANGGKAMARSVEMLEQLLDSGAVGKEDLESLKEMLAQSMGMPVEEVLERKEELQKELPPEGRRLFDLIERLYKPSARGVATPHQEAGGMQAGEEIESDADVQVTIRAGAVSPQPAAPPPGTASTSVKVTVKKPS